MSVVKADEVRKFEVNLILSITNEGLSNLDASVDNELQSWLEDLGFEVQVTVREVLDE
jgi:ABC-type sulfate/molybdate transport systems ATPase subunit